MKKIKILAGTFALLALLIGGGLLYLSRPAPESRVFYNGQVLTVDTTDSVAEAIFIDAGKVVATGSSADMLKLAGKHARATDLAGKTLVPGFVDAHSHFPGSGLQEFAANLNSPPIGEVTTIEQLQARLTTKLATVAEGDWLLGSGYDDTLLAEKRHPNRHDLDAVSTDRPIFIMHVSGHLGVINSKAIELLGLGPESQNPEGGTYDRDAAGEFTGLLLENAMMAAAADAMDFGVRDFFRMISYAGAEYAGVGVTTAQSGGVDSKMAQGLRLASRLGLVPMRLVLFPMHGNNGEEPIDHNYSPVEDSDEWLTMGPVKIISDGSIQGYTGYLTQAYFTPYHGDSEYRGAPNISLSKLTEAVSRYHAAGLQMAIHANGDAAIDNVITAFREAQRLHRRDDPRLILIHAQMAREDQLDAMQELGITPSFFSAHTYYWGDRHRDIFIGPERAARISPLQSAVRRGQRFSVHLDTPVVPMQPLLLWWSTVNRLTSSGQVLGPEQTVTPMQALRAMTIDAAWQIFQENNRGSLEAGKWADMVILSGDPLRDPLAIKDLRVVETIVGGHTIFAE